MPIPLPPRESSFLVRHCFFLSPLYLKHLCRKDPLRRQNRGIIRDQGEGLSRPYGHKSAFTLFVSIHQHRLSLYIVKPKAQAAVPSTDAAAASATTAAASTDAQPSVSTTLPTTTPVTTSDTTPGPASVDPTPAPPSATSAESAPTAFGASFLTGEALQTTINNMVEMGFPRDQVLRALRASFNNPDRAVEYLMTVCFYLLSP